MYRAVDLSSRSPRVSHIRFFQLFAMKRIEANLSLIWWIFAFIHEYSYKNIRFNLLKFASKYSLTKYSLRNKANLKMKYSLHFASIRFKIFASICPCPYPCSCPCPCLCPCPVWAWTCSMDADKRHCYAHSAWSWNEAWTWTIGHNAAWTCTWTCSMNMYMDMQHEHEHKPGHAAWTWTCSMNMDMQHEHGAGQLDMQHVHGL